MVNVNGAIIKWSDEDDCYVARALGSDFRLEYITAHADSICLAAELFEGAAAAALEILEIERAVKDGTAHEDDLLRKIVEEGW